MSSSVASIAAVKVSKTAHGFVLDRLNLDSDSEKWVVQQLNKRKSRLRRRPGQFCRRATRDRRNRTTQTPACCTSSRRGDSILQDRHRLGHTPQIHRLQSPTLGSQRLASLLIERPNLREIVPITVPAFPTCRTPQSERPPRSRPCCRLHPQAGCAPRCCRGQRWKTDRPGS